MNTEDLIRAISSDVATPAASDWLLWPANIAASALVALASVVATLHVRPDMTSALHDPRILFKFVATLSLAIPAALLAIRLSRPTARPFLLPLSIAPVLTLVAVGLELAVTPASTWAARMEGVHALFCIGAIPVLSLAPLAMILSALSCGAPVHLRHAGAIAGLCAGAIGAAAYATHCPDDSPLFVAVWYTVGIAIMTAVGAFLGPRFLRW